MVKTCQTTCSSQSESFISSTLEFVYDIVSRFEVFWLVEKMKSQSDCLKWAKTKLTPHFSLVGSGPVTNLINILRSLSTTVELRRLENCLELKFFKQMGQLRPLLFIFTLFIHQLYRKKRYASAGFELESSVKRPLDHRPSRVQL